MKPFTRSLIMLLKKGARLEIPSLRGMESLLALILLLSGFASLHAQTLYSENFSSYANGTTVGSGNPVMWTRTLGAILPVEFDVQSNAFSCKYVGAECVWLSKTIYIQNWTAVNLSVSLSATTLMEVSDYLNVYYKLNGGAEVLFATNGSNTGDYGARTALQSGISGSTVQIVIRVNNNASNEFHVFDNVTVTGVESSVYSENFASYADGTTTSSLWTISGIGLPFSVQSGRFQATNTTLEAVWQSSVMDISSYGSIRVISVDLTETSTLESDDYIKVYYKLDGGAETIFSTNGSNFDDFGSKTATQSTLTGSTFQIIIRLKNNSSEDYFWDNVTVTGAPPSGTFTPTTTATNVSCNGGGNGTVTLSVSGGLPPFSYSWSNSATTRNISGLTAASYTVTITDYNNTTASATQSVTQPATLTASTAVTNISCNGRTDGVIDLTVSGGTTAYTYLWSNGATTEDISGLAVATYTVTVTDANACTVTKSASITQPAVLAASTTKTDVNCYGEATGSITLTVSGGTTAYTYLWSNGAITQNLSSIGKGTYTVTVTDARGCTVTASNTITQPAAPLSISMNPTNPSTVGQSNGAVDLTVFNGTTPFTYSWSNGATTQNISNLPTGTYTVTVTDAKSCTVTGSQSISTTAICESATPYYTLDFTSKADTSWTSPSYLRDGLCCTASGADKCTGFQLTLNPDAVAVGFSIVSGAFPSGALYFQVNCGPQTLVNGVYCLSGNGPQTVTYCKPGNNANSYKVTSYGPPFATNPDSSSVGCAKTVTLTNMQNSTVNWTSVYPGTVGQYNSLLSCTSGCASTIFTATPTTPPYIDYHVTGDAVLGACGYITVSDTIRMYVYPRLALTLTKTDVTCNGQGDGSISSSVSGGVPPYRYSWSSGAAAQNLGGLSPGTYTLTVTDSRSCTASASVAVTQPAVLSFSFTKTDVTCNGGSDGSAIFSVAGGVSPDTLYDASGPLDPVPATFTGLSVTDVWVWVKDATGCATASQHLIISEPAAALSASITVTNATCSYSSNGIADLTVTGGSSPYTYSWNTGATTQDLSSRPAGPYAVTVTDANGCSTATSCNIASSSDISSTLTITDVTVNGGADGAISQSVSGGVSPYSYAWSNGAGTKNIAGVIAGTYTVTITDNIGCTITKSGTVAEPGACPCTWTGTVNNSWNFDGNWDCGFIPADTCNVVIAAATPFTCNILANAQCRNLTINALATLVASGTVSLDIFGNLTNNGTFTRNSSTVTFSGAAEQSISGLTQTSFNVIRINNTSATGVKMNKNILVYGDLRLMDGYLFTNSDTVKVETNSQGALLVSSPNSFIVGKVRRKINPVGFQGYEFPVGDAGSPTRFFRAYIRTHDLTGTDNLTVYFGPLVRYSTNDMLTASLNPPTDIDDYIICHHNIPVVRIVSGDTTTTTNLNLLGYTSQSAYLNQEFCLEKTIEEDGIQYSYLAPEGIWHFEPDEQPHSGFYDMILYVSNLSGLSDNNFGILKRPDGTDSRYWSGGNGVMNPFNGLGRKLSDGYAMRTMLTTFSDGGGGGGGGGGLPIELLDFNAKLVGDQVELTWATATETNNDYFTVEKSDGKNFAQIAIIPGAGNSTITKYYTKIDYEPFAGTSYYRLKQTDYDGKFDYSDVVSVEYQPALTGDDDNEVIIYPNPSGGQFSVAVKSATGNVTLSLYDFKGNLVHSETYSATGDDFSRQLNLEGLDNGVYYLKADLGSKTIYTKKLMLFGEK